MKKTVSAAFFISIVFTSIQTQATEIDYICWHNYPVAVEKNVVLIKLYPDFRSESERQQVFENIRTKFSDDSNDIDFSLIYGFDRHGWVRIAFPDDRIHIREAISVIKNIEGVEFAEPNAILFTAESKQTALSNRASETNIIAEQALLVDPKELVFENVRLKEVGCREVTVYNTTDSVVNTQAWIDGTDSINFKVLDGVSSFEIAPDSSKILELEFRPDSTRLFEAVLNIDHDTMDDQYPVKVQMTGEGWPVATSSEPIEQVADKITLEQNYPNPFNPSTQITFSISEPSHVYLAVYNSLGQQVSKLVNGSRGSGLHQVYFDASGLSSGTYIYRLEAQGRILQRQMTLVK